jgi:hypothetical protein
MDSLNIFTLEAASHLIQVALTPVFLLSGIAALLNVFAGRLARVADRLHKLAGEPGVGDPGSAVSAEIARLHRRSLVLDMAVVLGTMGAAATCLAILTLFLFGLSKAAIGSILLLFFGLSIVCTLGSVAAFGLEMLMSSQALRETMRFHVAPPSWRAFFRQKFGLLRG